MGLGEDGGFKTSESKYTASFLNYDDKVDANIKQINHRLSQYNPLGLIIHQLKKVNRVFAYGGDGYYQLNRYKTNSNAVCEYVLGGKNELLIQYCNVFRLLELFPAVLAVCYFFKKQDHNVKLPMIVLLGAMCFFFYMGGK